MMDRESVIERLPTHRDLRGLGMTHRRRAAEHSIRCVLNAIRADHREPDAWEAHDIVLAIGAVASGQYGLSTSFAVRALASPERRIARAHKSKPPEAAALFAGLEHVASLPCHEQTYSAANAMVCRLVGVAGAIAPDAT